MIHRALRVQERLRQFCRDEQYKDDLKNDTLTEEDWEYLHQVTNALRPFYDATQRLQGKAKEASHGSIWEAILALETLLAAMEKGSVPKGLNGRPIRRPTNIEITHQNAW
jgi:hypothetical protein